MATIMAQDITPGMTVRTLLHQDWRTVATVRVGRDRVVLTFTDGAEAGLGRYHRLPVRVAGQEIAPPVVSAGGDGEGATPRRRGARP